MLSDDKLWDLWNAQGTDAMSMAEAFVFARAIEAEVRAHSTAVEAVRADAIARLEQGGQSAAASILRHHFEQKGGST